MNDVPETRDSLLVRVCDSQDQAAWEQFVQTYRPVVYRIGRGRGLQDADAQDLAQRVLISVAAAIGRWQRDEGNTRFRHWLRRIAKNETLKLLMRRPRDLARGGSSAMNALHAEPDNGHGLDDEIELEYRRQLIRQAAEVVRVRAEETTWLAFSMTMIDGMAIGEAARELQRSEGVIYAARSRILRRIQDVVRELEEDDT